MNFRRFGKLITGCATGIFAGLGLALAEDEAVVKTAPVVVELFTSQSCSSCVAASKYFNTLAQREDVVALSWHVDYWNFLNTRQGRWVDPFSKPAFSQRQRDYNEKIRKRSSVYTPQMIINGEHETVGSARDKVEAIIATQNRMNVTIKAEAPAFYITFSISESDQGGNAYLVTFKPETKTDIRAGENTGVQFHNRNVVRNIEPLGVVLKRGYTD